MARNTSDLRVAHINAQSVSAHISEIRKLVENNAIHILAVSETWISRSSLQKDISIDNYLLYRNDRRGKSGGGVCFYVHRDIRSRYLARSDYGARYIKRPEFLLIEVSIASRKILCVVVYSPPRAGYWSEVDDAISNCSAGFDGILLCGDLNVDWRFDSTPRSTLSTSFATYGLQVLPSETTHHPAGSDSQIDYLCVSEISTVANYRQLSVPNISWHDALIVDLSYQVEVSDKRPITIRSRRHFNLRDFLVDLEQLDWASVFLEPSVHRKVEIFSSLLLSAYDRHTPFVTFVPKAKKPPWLTPEVTSLIASRDKAYRDFLRHNRDEEYREIYKRLRNRAKLAVRNAKYHHFRTTLNRCRDTKSLWKAVNDLGAKKRTPPLDSLPVHPDDLNNYFIGNFYTDPDSMLSFAAKRPDDCFYFSHVQPASLLYAIFKSKSNACGPDGIPLSYIRECLPVIFPVLLHIFDTSLQSGVFPDSWKHAIVIPIPKAIRVAQPQDLRPISIECSGSKLLEAVALEQLQEFISANKLLDGYQSGFRKNFCTQSVLTSLVDSFREGAFHEEVTLLVSIDFKQAFDSVNIPLLVSKLRALGLSSVACDWVASFLLNRTQAVSDPQGGFSASSIRHTGVPQGSLLGPTLFALFINDLPPCLKFCRYHLYADDLVIFLRCRFPDIRTAINHMNQDLEHLYHCSNSYGLVNNPFKTKAMWVGCRNFISRLNKLTLPPIILANEPIQVCSSLKLLGFTIDSTLTLKEQCIATTAKSFATLNRLKKIRDGMPESTRVLLVKTLVLPLLDYCAPLYCGSLSNELAVKMQRAKNASLRFITGKRIFVSVSDEYPKFNILRFENRVQYLTLTFLAKTLATGEPFYLANKIAFRHRGRYDLANHDVLDLQERFFRIDFWLHAFENYAPRLWNQLPNSIRALYTKPHAFKYKLYNYLAANVITLNYT